MSVNKQNICEIEKIIGKIDFFNCVNDVEIMQKIRDRIDDLIIEKLKGDAKKVRTARKG